MEDSKWEDSATQWEAAYRQVKADRDKLEAKLKKIAVLAESCQRGCDCEYDYRCGSCQALLDLKMEISDGKNSSGA